MSFPRRIRFILVSLVLAGQATLGASGCAGPHLDLAALTTPVAKSGVVFVVDGAGDFRACSSQLTEVCAQAPVQVIPIPWSHGYGRIVADQICYAHARNVGHELAYLIQNYKQRYPEMPIYLVAHSAGSAVAVSALESLPPQTVERALFLAPALSATYDVRPALKAVKYGLHVFYSQNDTAYLGIWTGVLGNSDRHWGPSSGRFGFQVPAIGPDDAPLYAKLFQRPWQPADLATGNDGRHYGDYQPGFVRQHVLPLLMTEGSAGRPNIK
jgi:hypothetical protein